MCSSLIHWFWANSHKDMTAWLDNNRDNTQRQRLRLCVSGGVCLQSEWWESDGGEDVTARLDNNRDKRQRQRQRLRLCVSDGVCLQSKWWESDGGEDVTAWLDSAARRRDVEHRRVSHCSHGCLLATDTHCRALRSRRKLHWYHYIARYLPPHTVTICQQYDAFQITSTYFLLLATFCSKRLCVGLVSVHPSLCPISRQPESGCCSVHICRHQRAAAASVLHCDPRDEDQHRLVIIVKKLNSLKRFSSMILATFLHWNSKYQKGDIAQEHHTVNMLTSNIHLFDICCLGISGTGFYRLHLSHLHLSLLSHRCTKKAWRW